MMKRTLLAIIAIAAIACVVGCSSGRRWSEKERADVRREVRAYRDMAYLDNLEEVEFDIFAGDVTEAIEIDYPVYTTFVELPGRGDTVEVYVVQTIVSELQADAHNMRKLYPYKELVAEGVLPPNLDRQAQRAFYQCFANSVDNTFASTSAFFNAVLADTTANSQIEQMQRQCASDLFDWVVEVDEIIFFD
jgi:hypothetical protein